MSSDSRETRGDQSPRIIAFLNQKGGVGKTTSAVNVGAAIAKTGRRVCLIDLDPQGHLTLHFGIDIESVQRTVYDLFLEPGVTAEDVRIRNVRPNLDVMLSDVDLAAAEAELAGIPDRHELLRRSFASISHEYDVVIIDCPPSLGLLTVNALVLADEIVVPMLAHFLALQGVGRLLETVGMVSQSVNPGLRVAGIVLCMHDSQTTLAREVVVDLEEFFEQAQGTPVPWSTCRLLLPPVRRNIKLAEAPSFGMTIFDYSPASNGASDYRALAQNLVASWKPMAGEACGEVEAKPDPGSDAAPDPEIRDAGSIPEPPEPPGSTHPPQYEAVQGAAGETATGSVPFDGN